MLFNSFEYVALVLLTMLLYYAPALRRGQILILIASSLVFYAWAYPWLLALLIASILLNTWTSYQVEYRPDQRRLYATVSVVLNLALLGFFKYSGLMAKTFMPPASDVGQWLILIPLPIGISFFTFEGLSLVIDVFRSKEQPKFRGLVPKSFWEHFLKITLFVSFFPHLVAGPILKAHEFIPQIDNKKLFGQIDWQYCFRHLVVGYFLKMVIADNLKDATTEMAYPHLIANHSSLTLWTFLFGYSMQIFADFAGYSLIALGSAGLFGYRLPENFNFPYISKSFKEFWKRWHISLSSFLMEYLYFSLGGNRYGKARTYFNLMMVMFLGGLWHGAAWSYAIWGLTHGIALALERWLGEYIKLPETGFIGFLRMMGVFLVVTLAWLMFRIPDFPVAWQYLTGMFTQWNQVPLLNPAILVPIAFYSLFVVAYHVHYLLQVQGRPGLVPARLPVLRPAAYGFMLFMIVTNSGNAGEFIYFQF